MNVGYRFGPFVLDPAQRAVTREGAPVPLTRKGFELLLYLVQHPNRIVTKQDLMKAVWPDTFVKKATSPEYLAVAKSPWEAGGPPHRDGRPRGVQVHGGRYGTRLSSVRVEAVPGPSRRPARIRWRMWPRDVSAAALPDPRVGERVYDESLDGRGRHGLWWASMIPSPFCYFNPSCRVNQLAITKKYSLDSGFCSSSAPLSQSMFSFLGNDNK